MYELDIGISQRTNSYLLPTPLLTWNHEKKCIIRSQDCVINMSVHF